MLMDNAAEERAIAHLVEQVETRERIEPIRERRIQAAVRAMRLNELSTYR